MTLTTVTRDIGGVAIVLLLNAVMIYAGLAVVYKYIYVYVTLLSGFNIYLISEYCIIDFSRTFFPPAGVERTYTNRGT